MTYVSVRSLARARWVQELRIPPDVPLELRVAAVRLARSFRYRRVPESVVRAFGVYVAKLGGAYVVPDQMSAFFLFPSSYLEKFFIPKPKVLVQAGARGSGKTVTAWTLALRWLKAHPNGQVHVVGDVDEMGPRLAELGLPVVVHEENYFPPGDRPELIIYNELTEETLSTAAVSRAGRAISLQQFRARHYRAWFVFNAVRHKSLLSAVRETADAVLARWMTPSLAHSFYEALPPGLSDLAFLTTRLDRNRAIALYSVQDEGTYAHVYPTDPPEWLLRLQRRPRRKRLPRVSRRLELRERNSRILELAAAGMPATKIAQVLEAEGWGRISDRHVRNIIRRLREEGMLPRRS